MSKHFSSHSIRNSTNNSVINIDVDVHEDIDYDFFESGDSSLTIIKPDQISRPTCSSDDEGTKEEKRDSNMKLVPCGDVDSNNSTKVMKLNGHNVKQREFKNKRESTVQFTQSDSEINLMNEIKSKEEKYVNLRELMNCIAYDGKHKGKPETDEDDDDQVVSKFQALSPDFLSLSTDTTSEITDVTTRPSSSGCSSMSKPEQGCTLPDIKTSKSKTTQREQPKKDKNETTSRSSMKLILDALDNFDKQEKKSITSSVSSTEKKNRMRRINMSFTNEQCRKIERENEILLKKLESLRKPRSKQQSNFPSQPKISSAAINRRKQQAKIDHDNMILLKKIEQAKPTTRIFSSGNLRR